MGVGLQGMRANQRIPGGGCHSQQQNQARVAVGCLMRKTTKICSMPAGKNRLQVGLGWRGAFVVSGCKAGFCAPRLHSWAVCLRSFICGRRAACML